MIATAKAHYDGNTIVLDAPVEFECGQEIVITYVPSTENRHLEKLSDLVDSLVGAIPDTGKSLAEYREERLSKYAHID